MTKRILMVLMLSAVALVLTSLLVATPVSAGSLPTNGVYDDDTPGSILTDTLPTTHPVGIVLALYFNIPYTEVMALHDEGFGFGNIARAYLTAYDSGGVLTPTQVLQMRLAGMGWGQIKQEYGIHPGGNGLGSIMRDKGATTVVTDTVAPPATGPNHDGPGGASCPGNSCNAPGHQKGSNGKPDKMPTIKGPKK